MDVSCDRSIFANRRKRVHVDPYEKLPPFHFNDEGLKLPELLWKETPETELAPPPPRHSAPEQARDIMPSITPSVHDDSSDESDTVSDDTASGAELNGRNQLPTGILRVVISGEETGPSLSADIKNRYKCSYCVHSVQDNTPRTYHAALIHRAMCPYNPAPDPGAIPTGLIPHRMVLSTSDRNVLERFLCRYCVDGGGSTMDREFALALIHRACCDRNPYREGVIPVGLYPIRKILHCDAQGTPVYEDEETFRCSHCIHAQQDTTERDLGEALAHRTTCPNNPHREDNVLEGLILKQSITVRDDDGNTSTVCGIVGGEDRFKCFYCVSEGNDSSHRCLTRALQHRAMCIRNPNRLRELYDPDYISASPQPESLQNPSGKRKKKKKTRRKQMPRQDTADTSMGISTATTSIKRPRLDSPLHDPQKKQKTSNHQISRGSENRQGFLSPQRPRRLVGDGRPQWTYLEGVIPIDEHWNGIQLTVPESEARYICEYCPKNPDNNPARSLKGASQHRIACPRNPQKAGHSSEHNRLYGEGRRRWQGKKLTGLELMKVSTQQGTRITCRACKRFKPTDYRTWSRDSGFRCHWQYCIYNCDNIDPTTASRIYPEMSQRSPLKVIILPLFKCSCCWVLWEISC